MPNSRLFRFLFRNSTPSQTIAKNTFWLSFGEITGRLLRVIVIFFAARILGAAGWGTFSYMTSLAAILTVFSDIGLSGILIREGAKSEELRRIYFSTALFLKMAAVAISFLLIVLVAPQVATLDLPPLLIYAAGFLMIFDALRVFGNAIFRSEERMQIEAGVNLLTQAVIVTLGFYVLFTSPSPELLATAYAIGSGVGLMAIIILIRKYIKSIFRYFRRDLVRKIFAYSWPIGFATLFGGLLVNIDTVMVGWFRDAASVGFYAAAQKPVAFMYLLPGFIVGGLLPVLARRAVTDREGFRRVMERGLSVTLMFACPIVVGIMLTAEKVVDFVYGSEYVLSAGPLRILAMSLLITFPATIIVSSVVAYNRQREMVPLWTAGIIFNTAANVILIPLLGIAGAAWASLLTQVGVNGFFWRKMRKINPFTVGMRLKSIIAASLIMAVAIIIANAAGLHILITILVAMTVYLASLVLLKDPTIMETYSIIKLRG